MWGGDIISALADMIPQLRGQLSESWRRFKAWRRLEPPERAKPVPRSLLRFWVFTLFMLLDEFNCFVILPCILHMLLCFSLMRPAEVRGLDWADISFDENSGPNGVVFAATIAIDHSKTSVRKLIVETLVITDPFIIFVLLLAKDFAVSSKVWPFGPTFFADFLKELQRSTGLSGFVPYSFKRGGASAHFAYFRSYDRLCQDGRWASVAAARCYIDDAVASLVRLRVPPHTCIASHARTLQRMMVKSGRVGYSNVLEM